jgi:hypothetical protein
MSVEKLVLTLRQVLIAEQEEQTARESYTGYDLGYHGYYLAEESRKAGEAFATALNEYIYERVLSVLAEKARRDDI